MGSSYISNIPPIFFYFIFKNLAQALLPSKSILSGRSLLSACSSSVSCRYPCSCCHDPSGALCDCFFLWLPLHSLSNSYCLPSLSLQFMSRSACWPPGNGTVCYHLLELPNYPGHDLCLTHLCPQCLPCRRCSIHTCWMNSCLWIHSAQHGLVVKHPASGSVSLGLNPGSTKLAVCP